MNRSWVTLINNFCLRVFGYRYGQDTMETQRKSIHLWEVRRFIKEIEVS